MCLVLHRVSLSAQFASCRLVVVDWPAERRWIYYNLSSSLCCVILKFLILFLELSDEFFEVGALGLEMIDFFDKFFITCVVWHVVPFQYCLAN